MIKKLNAFLDSLNPDESWEPIDLNEFAFLLDDCDSFEEIKVEAQPMVEGLQRLNVIALNRETLEDDAKIQVWYLWDL